MVIQVKCEKCSSKLNIQKIKDKEGKELFVCDVCYNDFYAGEETEG